MLLAGLRMVWRVIYVMGKDSKQDQGSCPCFNFLSEFEWVSQAQMDKTLLDSSPCSYMHEVDLQR